MNLARETFGFDTAAIAAFQFLITDFGFRVVQREPTLVRFESQTVFVNVYHGRSSYEIGIEVGPIGLPSPATEEKFMLGDILEAYGRPEALAFRQATAADEIRRCLLELAVLTKQHATRALVGDKAFYSELRATQARLAARFIAATQRLRRARVIASEAFRRGDYARVIAELRPLSRYLDSEDAGRLAEAENRLR